MSPLSLLTRSHGPIQCSLFDVGAGSGSFGKVIGQMDLPDIGAANLAQRRTADG
jgi:hypothetical protein